MAPGRQGQDLPAVRRPNHQEDDGDGDEAGEGGEVGGGDQRHERDQFRHRCRQDDAGPMALQWHHGGHRAAEGFAGGGQDPHSAAAAGGVP
ncbi:MAG TPA: hypothetical protein VHT75_19625, partial [Acidimicrobiales bacterium]|nr:hypothetical protein [Acidimicrobiales bacterium]